jgi:hypothetical protein
MSANNGEGKVASVCIFGIVRRNRRVNYRTALRLRRRRDPGWRDESDEVRQPIR